MQITWNTGRLYTDEGQIITAELCADCILFADHSRGIVGRIELPQLLRIELPSQLARHVMDRYDHGRYSIYTQDVLRAQNLVRGPIAFRWHG